MMHDACGMMHVDDGDDDGDDDDGDLGASPRSYLA